MGGLAKLPVQRPPSHSSQNPTPLDRQQQHGQPLMQLRAAEGLQRQSAVGVRQQQQPRDGVQVGWLTVGFVLLGCQPERTQQGVVDVAGCDGGEVAGADAEGWWW